MHNHNNGTTTNNKRNASARSIVSLQEHLSRQGRNLPSLSSASGHGSRCRLPLLAGPNDLSPPDFPDRRSYVLAMIQQAIDMVDQELLNSNREQGGQDNNAVVP